MNIDTELDTEGKSIAFTENGEGYVYSSIHDSWAKINNSPVSNVFA